MKQYDFSWDVLEIKSFLSSDLQIILPLFLCLLSFTIYWFIQDSEKIKSSFFNKKTDDKSWVNYIVFTKIFGGIIMGGIPAVLLFSFLDGYHLSSIGIGWDSKQTSTVLISLLCIGAIVLPLNYFNSKKPKNLENYPQPRAHLWTKKMYSIHILGWMIYLLGYEILFRGILLFPTVEALGVYPAIAINIAMYATTHIPKGLEETIGSIFMGALLCVLTLVSGSIWIAFFAHLFLSISNFVFSFHHHPEMKRI